MIKECEISKLDITIKERTQNHLDNLIKPVGSFASLEKMVVQAGSAQEKVIPDYLKKAMICLSSKEPSKTLKVLTEFAQADLWVCAPKKEEWTEQLDSLMGKFISEKINMIGVALPEWSEEEVLKAWGLLKEGDLEINGLEKSEQILFAVALYQKAAAQKILLMLDGPATWFAGILAMKVNPDVKEYFVSSRDGETAEKQEMLAEIGLEKGMKIGMNGDGGLSSALGFTLMDAAVRTIHDIATFAQAQVEYAYNAPTDKRM